MNYHAVLHKSHLNVIEITHMLVFIAPATNTNWLYTGKAGQGGKENQGSASWRDSDTHFPVRDLYTLS